MSAPLQIPPPGVPVLGPDGLLDLRWRTFFNALIARAGGILGGLQPEDDTLTALSGLNATPGLLTETSVDTFTKRSISGTAPISVANGSGTAGNPTISLNNSGVAAGTYAPVNSITVDAKGRITAIS